MIHPFFLTWIIQRKPDVREEVEERPGRPARYSGFGEYLIILVEEAVFRKRYYHR